MIDVCACVYVVQNVCDVQYLLFFIMCISDCCVTAVYVFNSVNRVNNVAWFILISLFPL